MTRRERLALIEWANSINDLKSDRLSSVGIDDFGDLVDEVPRVREWMQELFRILGDDYSA